MKVGVHGPPRCQDGNSASVHERSERGWCSVSSATLSASCESHKAAVAARWQSPPAPHLGDVQEVDLQEETQGTSRDLIGRSANGVAYLAADRQPFFVLSLGKDKKHADRKLFVITCH